MILTVKELLKKLKTANPEAEVMICSPNYYGLADRVLVGKDRVSISSEPPFPVHLDSRCK